MIRRSKLRGPGQRWNGSEALFQEQRLVRQHGSLRDLADEYVGHGLAYDRRQHRRRTAAAAAANDDRGAHQHHDGEDYQGDDHAVSTSLVRFTRWLTTLEDAPGTMVTP